eukprot:1800431-Pleurochrysis_carterae.AAC.3
MSGACILLIREAVTARSADPCFLYSADSHRPASPSLHSLLLFDQTSPSSTLLKFIHISSSTRMAIALPSSTAAQAQMKSPVHFPTSGLHAIALASCATSVLSPLYGRGRACVAQHVESDQKEREAQQHQNDGAIPAHGKRERQVD